MPTNYTKLSDLITKFLKSIDSYNVNDLALSETGTDQDTLGERAKICLNLALSIIYGLIKDSKYLEALPSTAISSVTGQDWIDLSIVPGIDDVETLADQTNDFKLVRRSWSWYRRNYADPSTSSGVPNSYIIRNTRLYFAPRPSEVIPYLVDFKKLTDDLKLAGDFPLIPTQYDAWIIAEAKVKFYEMEDPTSVPPLVISERNDARQIGIDSVLTGYDIIRVAESHFSRIPEPRTYGYTRPVGTS